MDLTSIAPAPCQSPNHDFGAGLPLLKRYQDLKLQSGYLMTLSEIDSKIKHLESLKKKELSNERAKDLSLVKSICVKHGFTERMLKGSLRAGRNRRTKEQLVQSA